MSQAVEEAVSQAVEKAKDEAKAYFGKLPTPPDVPIRSLHDGSNGPEKIDRTEEEE